MALREQKRKEQRKMAWKLLETRVSTTPSPSTTAKALSTNKNVREQRKVELAESDLTHEEIGLDRPYPGFT